MRKESSQNKNESARSKKNFFFPDSSFFFLMTREFNPDSWILTTK